MSKEFIKPLTPEFRSDINISIDNQIRDLKTCQTNVFVLAQMRGLSELKNLINALPDGYPIPMKKD